MNVNALVFIKAHSERVPGKNFRSLGGKPLYRWILDRLLAVPAITRLTLNTDAVDEVRRLGLPEDSRVVLRDRPLEVCGTHLTANTLLTEQLPHEPAGTLLMTHATNPFLRSKTIARAIERFHTTQATNEGDSLFSVTRHQDRLWDHHARPMNHDPRTLRPTQTLDPVYVENSCLYLFTKASFAQHRTRIGVRPVLFETAPLESVDIDTEDDWSLAEALAPSAR